MKEIAGRSSDKTFTVAGQKKGGIELIKIKTDEID